MSNPVNDFRQLTTTEMHEKLRELASVLDGNLDPPELADFALGLIGHLLTCTSMTFSYVEKLKKVVAALPQSNEAKDSLLAELEEYVFRAPALQERTRDRIHAALVAKPAAVEKKKVKKSIDFQGREFEFPENWEP